MKLEIAQKELASGNGYQVFAFTICYGVTINFIYVK